METLIELKLLNSSFSSSHFSIRVFRAYPLIDIRHTVPCRAIRHKSSDSRQQYLNQQYPPPSQKFTGAQAIRKSSKKSTGVMMITSLRSTGSILRTLGFQKHKHLNKFHLEVSLEFQIQSEIQSLELSLEFQIQSEIQAIEFSFEFQIQSEIQWPRKGCPKTGNTKS